MFFETWSQRIEQYSSHYDVLEKKIQEDMGAFVRDHPNIDVNDQAFIKDLVAQVAVTANDAQGASTIVGKKKALQDFLTHIRSQPNPGITDIWFKNRFSDLIEEARLSEKRQSEFDN